MQALPHGNTQHLADELRVLQAMCTGTPQGAARSLGLALLRGYRFRDAIHQTVFDVLTEILSDDPAILREQLPARLTRKGFPDADCALFFNPHGLSLPQTEQRMRELASNND